MGPHGAGPLNQHPTLQVDGDAGGTYQVVGVVPRQGFGDEELQVKVIDAIRF